MATLRPTLVHATAKACGGTATSSCSSSISSSSHDLGSRSGGIRSSGSSTCHHATAVQRHSQRASLACQRQKKQQQQQHVQIVSAQNWRKESKLVASAVPSTLSSSSPSLTSLSSWQRGPAAPDAQEQGLRLSCPRLDAAAKLQQTHLCAHTRAHAHAHACAHAHAHAHAHARAHAHNGWNPCSSAVATGLAASTQQRHVQCSAAVSASASSAMPDSGDESDIESVSAPLTMEEAEEQAMEENRQAGGAGIPDGGMAEAFGVSPRTALAITTVVCCAALVAPPLLLQGTSLMSALTPLRTRALAYLTMLLGFYMAWNIGANDVANAMGTSVGSGALTLRQAVLTAAFLEFGGAFLVGSHVSHTMQSGIINAEVFAGRSTTLFTGMISSLAASGTWLQVASYFGWPVSTTHCIIGAMVGFGLVYGGVGAVYWTSLARVVSSWVVSPLFGASIAYIVYRCIRQFVYGAPNPGQAACAAAPVLVFAGVTAFAMSSLVVPGNMVWGALQALASGTVAAVLVSVMIERQLGELMGDFCEIPKKVQVQRMRIMKGPSGTQLRMVYVVFGYLQVLSACFMSFAHGANDVANAIGPISAALAILNSPSASAAAATTSLSTATATKVLVWGGFGIVAGLLVWGYRVIATIGKRITELTPTRGFAAEFSAATVVVLASRMGLPISATHTLVGAVMGVGLARGLNSVRGDVVKEIAASWIVTIPIGAVLSVFYCFIFMQLLPLLGGF